MAVCNVWRAWNLIKATWEEILQYSVTHTCSMDLNSGWTHLDLAFNRSWSMWRLRLVLHEWTMSCSTLYNTPLTKLLPQGQMVVYILYLFIKRHLRWNWAKLGTVKATFSVRKLIPKTLKWLPYILIGHCTSLSPWFIILDKNNFVKFSHHYLTSGGYQVCL